jgi:hypothetical protein
VVALAVHVSLKGLPGTVGWSWSSACAAAWVQACAAMIQLPSAAGCRPRLIIRRRLRAAMRTCSH